MRTSDDGTLEFLRKITNKHHAAWGASMMVGGGATEQDSRNIATQYFRRKKFDWVFCLDEDEIYDQKALEYLIDFMKNDDKCNPTDVIQLHGSRMITFWRDENHEIWPRPTHEPIIAVRPWVDFIDCRCVDMSPKWNKIVLSPPGYMRHYSWIRGVDRTAEKLNTYGHAEDIPKDWFEKVYLTGADSSDYGPIQFEAVADVQKKAYDAGA